jgi:hypothetical protein
MLRRAPCRLAGDRQIMVALLYHLAFALISWRAACKPRRAPTRPWRNEYQDIQRRAAPIRAKGKLPPGYGAMSTTSATPPTRRVGSTQRWERERRASGTDSSTRTTRSGAPPSSARERRAIV